MTTDHFTFYSNFGNYRFIYYYNQKSQLKLSFKVKFVFLVVIYKIQNWMAVTDDKIYRPISEVNAFTVVINVCSSSSRTKLHTYNSSNHIMQV